MRTCFFAALLSLVCFAGSDAFGQVGYGVRQGTLTTGASVRVGPVVTGGGRYVRTGISASFSQLVDVQTFSPVQNFPGLVPFAPIGFGTAGGAVMGNNGMAVTGGNPGAAIAANRGPITTRKVPTVPQFLAAAFRLDADDNKELDRDELKLVGNAVLTELQQTPGFDVRRLLPPTAAGQAMPTEEQMLTFFVDRSLKFDRNADEKLDRSEAERMATALIRSLL